MKCSWHECTKEAVIFELPFRYSRPIRYYARHCQVHYKRVQGMWDKDLLMGSATYDEQEYLLDALKASI